MQIPWKMTLLEKHKFLENREECLAYLVVPILA